MRHLLYALFTQPGEAERAIEEIHALDRKGGACEIFVHKGKVDAESLPLGATRASLRLVEGMLIGALLGAAIGAFILQPAGLVQTSPGWTAIFCAVLGALCGGLGGLLQGAAGPDPVLESLAESLEHGAVLVKFRAEDKYHLEQAEAIARGHGARLFDRGGVRPLPRRVLRRLSLSQHT